MTRQDEDKANQTLKMIGSTGPKRGAQPPRGTPTRAEPHSTTGGPRSAGGPTYTKVFRWRLPDGETNEPQTVEVAGTFNNWQRVPLQQDGKQDAWHATVHHIPGNRTHHYMLFVDGKPTADKNSDGMAIPHGPQEEQYAVDTMRGPRVMMMFAMAK